jgi:hypothetical protein
LLPGLVTGLVGGLLCAPIAQKILRHKELSRAVRLTLVLHGAPCLLLGWVVPWFGHFHVAIFIICLAQLITLKWIALVVLPDHFDLTRSLGKCWRCDYDLTGNTSGICPECGTPIAPVAEKQPRKHFEQQEI